MTNKKNSTTKEQWSLIIWSALGWSGIMSTGWLFEYFYSFAQEALVLSNVSMGVLVSLTEGIGICGYFISGLITDYLKPQRTMDIGAVLAIAGGVLLILFPLNIMAIPCCLLMTIGGVVFYCTACLRLIADCGKGKGQGKTLGYFYSIFGVMMLLEGSVIAVIVDHTSARLGLIGLMVVSCIQILTSRIAVRSLAKRMEHTRDTSQMQQFKFSAVKGVLTNRRMWLLMLIGMTTQCSAVLISFTQPLLTTAFGVSDADSLNIVTFISYVPVILFALMAGMLIDRFQSATRLAMMSYICLFIGCIVVLIMPWAPQYLWILIVALGLLRTVNAICMPSRQALIFECGVPGECHGTAVGLLSAALSIPGAVMGTWFGNLLMAFEGSRMGYQIIYYIFILISIIGTMATLRFRTLKSRG